jgi:hypothetical protein
LIDLGYRTVIIPGNCTRRVAVGIGHAQERPFLPMGDLARKIIERESRSLGIENISGYGQFMRM